jgi:hypothetical protein
MLWSFIVSTTIVQGRTGQHGLLRVSTPRAAICPQLSDLRKPATLEDIRASEPFSAFSDARDTRAGEPFSAFSDARDTRAGEPFSASSDASDTRVGEPFSASRWHRERRRQILAAHPEVRDLIGDDSWVFTLGLVILPLYAWVLWHSPEMSWEELAFHVWTTCSLRASWAVYCSHAISHGRWRGVGPLGSARFNLALATCNIGTVMGILPSYWLTHHGHHTNLGKFSVAEARQRAKEGRQTDGDIGIASRAFSPPSRKYRVATGHGGGGGDDGAFEPRVSEGAFQATAVAVHALAPAVFAGYLTSALRSPISNSAMRRSLAVQAAASLAGWLLVAALSVEAGSAAPLGMYLLSQLVWLSPLNLNFIWTCPHLCEAGSGQPTVSFYTPANYLGAALDAYMGFENYHVEHHDFPDVPMYHLPRLRAIAPEHYEGLRSAPLLRLSTWRDSLGGTFYYACQDFTF